MLGKKTDAERELAEARQLNEELRTAAAEAEEGLMEARSELEGRTARIAELEAEVGKLRSAGESGRAATDELRSNLKSANEGLAQAVEKYREVRLCNAPEIPHELVPLAPTIGEIDAHFERAEKVVENVRTRLADEKPAGLRPRWSVGPTRYPDTREMSAQEKISIGLKRLAERENAK